MRLRLLCLLLSLQCLAFAQNTITESEYWFDDDYAGKVVTALTPAVQLNFTGSVSAAGLSTGLHTLHIRFKQSDTTYSTTLSRQFINFGAGSTGSTAITGYEYWFDDDYTNKVLQTVSNPSIQFLLDDSISVSGLSGSVHAFHIRFRDNSNRWSAIKSSYFIKTQGGGTGSAAITGYEYWFDDGYANKVLQTVSNPGIQFLLDDSISASGLSGSFHALHIRFRDNSNRWSAVKSSYFIKTPAGGTGSAAITGYEYWFDEDYANKISGVTQAGKGITLAAGIPLQGLNNGMHRFHIRFKDDGNKWSSTRSQHFFKRSGAAGYNGPNIITAYRYWIDTGFSSVKTVILPDPVPQTFIFNPVNLANHDTGWHTLHLQFRDTMQVWSSVVTDSFLQLGKPRIDYVSPNVVGNFGFATVFIHGTGFYENTAVKFTRAGQQDIVIDDSMRGITMGQAIEALVPVHERDTGFWNLVVTVPNDTVMILSNAIKLTTAVDAEPTVNIIGPSAQRINMWQTYQITCTNTGNTNLFNVPLYIALPDSAELRFGTNIEVPANANYNFDTIRKYVIVDTLRGVPFRAKLFPLLVKRIPPNTTIQLPVEIKKSIPTPIRIKGWSEKPVSEMVATQPVPPGNNWKLSQGFKEGVLNCMSTALNNFGWGVMGQIIGDVPCIMPVLNTLVNTASIIDNSFNDDPEAKSDFLNYGLGLGEAIGECAPFVATGPYVTALAVLGKIASLESQALDILDCYNGIVPTDEFNKLVNLVYSLDPNEKYGPANNGMENYVSANDIPYTINFENDSSATAAAQTVLVVDSLDTSVYDLSSFRLGAVHFGNTTINFPSGLKKHTTYKDLRPLGHDLILKVEAGLNDTTGVATWLFTSLDPNTMQLTTDPYAGFLPPNDSTGKGEGGVFFSIKAKDNLPNNTPIHNKAYIYFDNNAPVATGTWSNILDNIKPVSAVNPLPASDTLTTFTVSWHGSDSSSGIKYYSVYVSHNNAPYTIFRHNTSDTSASFTGTYGSAYTFYSIATDTAGNKELPPLTYDTKIQIIGCNIALQAYLDTIGATTICEGDTVVLKAYGGNFYTWSNSLSTDSIKVFSAGTYSVTVTDTFGCSVLLPATTITIKPSPNIQITAANNSVCAGDSTLLTASGGTSYLWQHNNATSGSLYILPAVNASYILSGTGSNGCTAKDTVDISVLPLPNISISSISDSVCLGDTQVLTANGGVSYNWQPGNYTTTTLSVSPSINTQYILQGTGANNCLNRDTIDIIVKPLPVISITAATDTICTGDILVLIANGGISYNWQPGNDTTINLTVVPSANTSYLLTGQSANGCFNTDSLFVTVHPLPVIQISASTDSICTGDTVMLSASGGINYNWLPINDTNTLINVSPLVNTNYILQGTDGNSCSNTDSLFITVLPLPVVSITAANDSLCLGDTLSLGANGAMYYLWQPVSDTANTIIVAPNINTQYHLTGTDVYGCSNADSLLITVLPLPALPLITWNGDLLQSNYTSGNQWYKDGTLINGASTDTLTPLASGIYTVNYTDAYGCSAVSSGYSINLGINDLKDNASIRIYPNPTDGTFIIEVENIYENKIEISLTNILGQEIMNKDFVSVGGSLHEVIDIRERANGMYLLTVKTTSLIRTYKVLKQ